MPFVVYVVIVLILVVSVSMFVEGL